MLVRYLLGEFVSGIVVISSTELCICLFSHCNPDAISPSDWLCYQRTSISKWVPLKKGLIATCYGGSSQIRYRRLRKEREQNWVESAVNRVNQLLHGFDFKQIIVAGTHSGIIGNFAYCVASSPSLDPNIKGLISHCWPIAYGGKLGVFHVVENMLRAKDTELMRGIMQRISAEYDDEYEFDDEHAVCQMDGITIGVRNTVTAMMRRQKWLKYVVLASEYYYQYVVIADNEQEDPWLAVDEAELDLFKQGRYQSLKVLRFEEYFLPLLQQNNINMIRVGQHSRILHQFYKGFEGCIGLDRIE